MHASTPPARLQHPAPRRGRPWLRWGWGWAWLAVLWLWAAPVLAREVPPLRGRVNDEAGVLSTAEESQLEQRLAAYEQATGRQFAVLTIDSLQGDPLEDFSIRVVEAWKLGREDQDDGLLLLLAVEDRKVRIEVGYGLEGEVTDLVSARIIHDVMRPHLRRGDYDQAVAAGVEALIAVAGPAVAPPEPPSPSWWESTFHERPVLWYGLMAAVLAAVLAVCWWRPVVGVIGVVLAGQYWWPAALVGALALWLRWQWSHRRRMRDGYGVDKPTAAPRSRRDRQPSWWRSFGLLWLLSNLGRGLSSRPGRDFASGVTRTIASRGAGAFLGRGGGFGGGGASGGW